MTVNMKYRYFSQLSVAEQLPYQSKLYAFLRDLNHQYPDFRRWYLNLFRYDGALNDGREIIFCETVYHQIAGIIILKKTDDESKICTLRVSELFRGEGIGTKLVELGINWLKCEHPLITVSRKLYPQYRNLFRYYGFRQEEKKWGYYSILNSEYVFNGTLGPRPRIIKTVEAQNLYRYLIPGLLKKREPSQKDFELLKRFAEMTSYSADHEGIILKNYELVY